MTDNNTLVTEAILRAEELESRGLQSIALAVWAQVSSIEEELAKSYPVSDVRGQIARRGAVTAALKAGNYSRAYALADSYLTADGVPDSLRSQLG